MNHNSKSGQTHEILSLLPKPESIKDGYGTQMTRITQIFTDFTFGFFTAKGAKNTAKCAGQILT
jgi:hypothetical protein